MTDKTQQRIDHAKALKNIGRRAYSDSFNHIIVKMYNTEHGMDLACAIQLRDALDDAISVAARPDDMYP